jgi:helix-turn-helix protein
VIKFALKIQITNNKKLKSEVVDNEPEKLVKVVSYVDMNEAKPYRQTGRRRNVFPKFKENIINDDTKWVVDQPDFNGMMHEFRFHETARINQPEKSKTTRNG